MGKRDVIIAGGGPAGAAAATVLARAGIQATIVDRAVFPRDKLCAGLFTWKTIRSIARIFGASAESLLADGVINHVSPAFRIRHRETVLSEGPLVYPFHFVDRAVFDAWCLERARRAGAEVVEGERVVFADPERATVRTASGREFAGAWLIGADGALSQVRKSFALDPASWRAEQGLGLELLLGREWLAERAGLHEDVLASFPTIYSGFVEAGYAWVFPHKDRVVVGIGGLHRVRGKAVFQRSFDDFLRFLGIGPGHGLAVRGYPLPYGNWLRRPFQGRTLLAGDAAGMVEPLFGEGIHYALRTGELAGQACAEALHADSKGLLSGGGGPSGGADAKTRYLAGLEADVFPELVWSKRLRHVLYWFVARGLILPVRGFLGGGGSLLQEMVHGMRSFRWLRKRT